MALAVLFALDMMNDKAGMVDEFETWGCNENLVFARVWKDDK
jgi:hypothetical protein